MAVAVLLFTLIGGVVGLLLLVAAFRRWPTMPLYAVTILSAIAWDLPGLHRIASVGDVSITAEDMVVVSALVATALNPGRLLAITKPYRLILVALTLGLVGALIAGLFRFDTGMVMNDFRAFLFPIGFTAWALNQDWMTDAGQRAFKQWITITGATLTAVAAIHIAIYGVGQPDTFVVSVLSGVSNTGRPLASDQAMLLGLIGLLMFRAWGSSRPGRDRWVGILFLAMSIACQHRSVWVAVFLGIALTSFRLRGVARARALAGAFCALLLGAIAILSGALTGVVSSLFASVENTGTLDGRLSSWTQLVESSFARGIWTILLGEPFGFGYDRIEAGQIISYAPHNWYVTVYLRLGLVGLGIFTIVMTSTFARLARGAEAVAVTAAFLAIATYISAYSLSWTVAALLAWCIAAATNESSGREPQIPMLPKRQLAGNTRSSRAF
ncbi:hypothetical protein [Cryobacterium sp. TMT2-42-4]|uniref:O-antigen ligase family protein n=1 Tax=Cryobacterium sp. TMT2-42-4 TaxID=1259255 RepID=UPI001069E764|nr:hypothetical protein [Cryobacterium sp. TMT2-42-4]TFC33956.1 hypothetical protein E3O18_12955 [Cryobacterium sp. TMT2-42-4]